MKNRNLNPNLRYAVLFLVALLCNTYGKAQTITTFAGTGTAGFTGDGGAAVAARIENPWGATCDSSGNLYFTDGTNQVIRKVTPAGIISTIAGVPGSSGESGDGGPATAALMTIPRALAVGKGGNIYVIDDNFALRKIDPSGTISTVAGTAYSYGLSGDGGPATAARLHSPIAVAADRAGNVYIAEWLANKIRKIDTAGIITTYAGNGSGGFSGDGGPATAAQIDTPLALAVDTAGNLYVSCYSSRVRKISASGTITTIAGTGVFGYTGDGGSAASAKIGYVWGIVADKSGNLYMSDNYFNRVRRISATGIITSIVAWGGYGYAGDGGPSTSCMLAQPMGVTIDSIGNLLIADMDNNRIRKVDICRPLVANVSGLSSICYGDTTIFADITVGGSWSSSNPLVASVNSATGKVTGIAGGTATITYGVTTACGTTVATHPITIIQPYAGHITGFDSVCPGSTLPLHDGTAGGTWSSADNSIATVSAAGLVTGVANGTVAIRYIASGICGADTASFTVVVRTNGLCNTGVSGLQQAGGFDVFPNPSHGSFTIKMPSFSGEGAQAVVADLLGRKVATFTIADGRDTNVSLAVPAGLYFLTVDVNGERITRKLTVE